MKSRAKSLFHKIFELGQIAGIDILPRNFYSEIPNIRELRRNTHWRAPRSMEGLSGDIPSQVAFVDRCTTRFKADLPGWKIHRTAMDLNGIGEGYSEIDADFLYCFVRTQRPPTIVQIGCGLSTAVCLRAAQDEGYKPKVICIEPYPTGFLEDAAKSGTIELIPKKLQEVGPVCAEWVGEGGFFFVDSTHTLGPAGEVSQIVLEVLPRLVPGAYAHFHDIWFPYDYCPEVLSTAFHYWHETALLYAFLCMNSRYRIAASLSLLYHQRKPELQRSLPHMQPAEFVDGVMVKEGQYPCAIYLAT